MFYENVFVPDKLIKLTDFYIFVVNWISLYQVLGITRMYLCTSPGLVCGMDLFHTHTQNLLCPITVLAKTRPGWPEQIRTDLALVFKYRNGSAATDLIARITESIAVLTI